VAHMASIPKAADLAALSVAERLDLMDQIWESLEPSADAVPLPEWHLLEVDKELAALKADGDPGQSLEVVLREIKSRL
jgi:putative addiction module component (TIGR02574 family)